MRIATRLQISVAVLAVVVLTAGTVIALTLQQVRKAERQHQAAHSVVEGMFELNTLTYDYVIHPGKRAQAQWSTKHASLAELLRKLEPGRAARRAAVQKMRENHKSIGELFARLAAHKAQAAPENEKADKQLEETVVTQLLVKSHLMASAASGLARQSQEELRSMWRRASLAVMAAMIIIAVVMVGVSFLTRRSLLKPVSELQKGTEIIGMGNLDFRVGTDARDEIGDLSRAFDQMTENLRSVTASRAELEHEITGRKQAQEELAKHRDHLEKTVGERTAELRKSEENFRLLVENVADYAIFMLDGDGIVLSWNAGAESIKGYKADEIIGKHFSVFYPPEDVQAGKPQQELKAAVEQGRFEEEGLRLRKDGSTFQANVIITPVRDEAGQLRGFAKVTRDITERKRAAEELEKHREHLEELVHERTSELEQRISQIQQLNNAMVNLSEDLRVTNANVESTARELAAANAELESFAYSVSHDLRTPLRAMDGFSLALLEDCSDKLDEQAREHLGRIRAAAQRMARLIDDLLGLSRVTRAEMQRETVDLSALAGSIADDLKRADPQREVELAIAPDLRAEGDRRLLEIALRNLLDNAWKFTAPKPGARIEFAAEQVEGQRAFFVRDDGAGFDMAYVNKLFGAFQRLHSTDEFPGTGIGLATVQRVVHRHGGKVWAEGEVDKGATFYFTLPQTPES